MRRAIVVLLLTGVAALQLQPIQAQSQGEAILRQRTVELDVVSPDFGGRCLGFRLHAPEFPPEVDLVLTAAHCVSALGRDFSITVRGLNGSTGEALAGIFWDSPDVAFLLVRPRLGPLTPVRNIWTNPPVGLQVLALIVVGGGRPTLTDGRVLGVEGGYIRLLLPGAPGSSGGAVVDTAGALVGMISAGQTVTRGAAGFITRAVNAALITSLLDQQRARLMAKALEIRRAASPPAPPPPAPPAEPSVTKEPARPAPAAPPAAAAPPSPEFDDRIVPGVRISGIALGMSLNQASAAAISTLGKGPASARRCEDAEDYRRRGLSCHIRSWDGAEGRLAAWIMFVGAPGQETVAVVGSSLPSHKTAEGLGPGSSLDEFVQAYGPPERGAAIQGQRGAVTARDGSPAAWWPTQRLGVFLDRVTQRVWGVVVYE